LAAAAIIGAVTMYGTVQVIGTKVDVLGAQVQELKADQKKMPDTITSLRVAAGK
jgi:outer membrane murein-binding lipoprotein Lpp